MEVGIGVIMDSPAPIEAYTPRDVGCIPLSGVMRLVLAIRWEEGTR